MSYNRLLKPAYYNWRKTLNDDKVEYDTEQHKHVETIERGKFKDKYDFTVNDCAGNPIDYRYYMKCNVNGRTIMKKWNSKNGEKRIMKSDIKYNCIDCKYCEFYPSETVFWCNYHYKKINLNYLACHNFIEKREG